MKKYKKISLFLLACFLLSGCTMRLPDASTSSVNKNQPAKGTFAPPPTADPAKVIPQMIGSEAMPEYEIPSVEQRERMAGNMGNFGFSVLRDDENMLNYKSVAEFFQNAAAGKEGEVTVYTYPRSYVISRTFSYKNGKMTCAFNEYTAQGSQPEDPQNVDEFMYTKKGNFIYHLAGSSEQSGFRVLPLSDESRAYFRKYIVPVHIIFSDGPLDVSWSSQDFSRLNWDWIFEGLWRNEYGTSMFYSAYYRKASDSMHLDNVVIPGRVVEGLLQKYFNASAQTLRAMDAYDKNAATYTFEGFRGGGYSPTLEVSQWQKNNDGTLTLWIDFVALEFGKELSAQSVLTIKTEDDGSFRYISNKYSEIK